MKFIFDLDGTITAQETLPVIAKKFHLEKEILNLTNETIKGNIPFVESFIRRVHVLGKLSVSEISDLLSRVRLHKKVLKFINENKDNCVIATGNLDCWIDKLSSKIDCVCYNSVAKVEKNKVVSIEYILNKDEVVKKYKELGEKVVYIGDGNNDMEAMRISDISIAAGLIHYPANSILTVADYLIFNEEALCRQLNQLL
ncbi:MAG: HAD-IB family phosphatase [Bacteroidales bacterium]|jgi:HAD superfamily phosphoserine phosphatase-like hydrolase|nr:HAD-IB family phosphatase [Bacteroidales bacterium]MDD4214151.1 HAD-IB family phosphatase [Bacteroidales bacterium]